MSPIIRYRLGYQKYFCCFIGIVVGLTTVYKLYSFYIFIRLRSSILTSLLQVECMMTHVFYTIGPVSIILTLQRKSKIRNKTICSVWQLVLNVYIYIYIYIYIMDYRPIACKQDAS